jgi:hypothetical protein
MTEPLTALLDHEGTDCKQARFWRYEHDREVIRAHDCRKAFAQVDDELQALRASLDARDDGLRESIDAVADALNAWDQGEPPRPDTHRHWSRIVAALSPTRTESVKPEYGGALYRLTATPEPAGLDVDEARRRCSKGYHGDWCHLLMGASSGEPKP